MQNLDVRRQKIIPVNSYFASYADLPPVPSVESKLMDDFTLDLQQIASDQICRIDEESRYLMQQQPFTEEPFEAAEEEIIQNEKEISEGEVIQNEEEISEGEIIQNEEEIAEEKDNAEGEA